MGPSSRCHPFPAANSATALRFGLDKHREEFADAVQIAALNERFGRGLYGRIREVKIDSRHVGLRLVFSLPE